MLNSLNYLILSCICNIFIYLKRYGQESSPSWNLFLTELKLTVASVLINDETTTTKFVQPPFKSTGNVCHGTQKSITYMVCNSTYYTYFCSHPNIVF